MSAPAIERLRRHAWPGNIRELRNALDRARLYADDGIIRPEHLPGELNPAAATPASGAAFAAAPAGPASAQGETLAQVVASFRGTRRELAVRLGLSERTLYRRLKAIGLA